MVIADTGFWLALANRHDNDHVRAVSCLERITEPLITTWPAVTETSHLLRARMGNPAQRAFLQSYSDGAFDLFELTRDHVPRLVELMMKYTDLPMDLTDASLVLLAEHLGHGRILSTDRRDFHTYRWKQHKPFDNLLIDEGG